MADHADPQRPAAATGARRSPDRDWLDEPCVGCGGQASILSAVAQAPLCRPCWRNLMGMQRRFKRSLVDYGEYDETFWQEKYKT